MEVKTLHPLIKIAAVSVTALSLAGVGVLTGILPAPGQNKPAETPSATMAATEPAPATIAAPAATTPPAAAKTAPPVAASKPKESAKRAKPVTKEQPAAATVAQGEAVPAKAAAPVCKDCGVIENIMEVKKPGEGTGLGAVAGGVLGGLLGNQVGGGKGRTAMAVLGAAGGAYAGHQVEKNARSNMEYQITVRFDDGTTQRFTEANPPAWRQGDRVKVSDGILRSAD
ncbi:glycine zipper 2TM domain-containing protein [Azospira sp. APE16]|uniref:glycine zipper 2TM domain-containing protein n=1 Tax=Azospira sp. APE16 TaxID=3394231 RepID=UPI003A4DC31B